MTRIEAIRIFYIESDHSYMSGALNWLYLHEYTLGCSKIKGAGGHLDRFWSDFDWLVLHDQTELDDKRGIQQY